jgi:hypothetical protein
MRLVPFLGTSYIWLIFRIYPKATDCERFGDIVTVTVGNIGLPDIQVTRSTWLLALRDNATSELWV